jgi:hypothetical protein
MMKYKKPLIISLVCILMASGLLIAWSASSRLLRAYDYASQFATAARVSDSSTNLSLVTYGDPQSLRHGIELFQFVKAQNIEWRGTSTDQQGNPVNVAFKLGSVNFGKMNQNRFAGNATGLDAHVSMGDLLDATVKADKVDINVTFWTYMNTFPAVNVTGILTGNVYVRFSVSVLPFLGLDFALYEYSGDRFSVSICGIKPMNLAIEAPVNGQRVRGDVMIQALIQAVPELSVENVMCRTDYGEQIPMQYNDGNGRWECMWKSYNSGNRWTGLNVHAEGVVRKSGQEFRYPMDAGINVEIDNPFLNSYVSKQQGLEMFGGLRIDLRLDSNSWSMQTGFNFWPAVGLNLTAQEYWMDGNVRFSCWRIDDEQGNALFQSPDLTLTITQEISNMLSNNGGKARELKCIYMPTQP